jgi:hypothetical protein
MFIRWKTEDGPSCRAILVDSVRTLSGPRLKHVAYLGSFKVNNIAQDSARVVLALRAQAARSTGDLRKDHQPRAGENRGRARAARAANNIGARGDVFCSGSNPEVLARKGVVRFALKNRHGQPGLSRLKSANNGHSATA